MPKQIFSINKVLFSLYSNAMFPFELKWDLREKLTLIDSMDTLLLTGDLLQFRRLEEIVRQMSFDIDKNVSVFETNIRIVGGLISSHLLYRKVSRI